MKKEIQNAVEFYAKWRKADAAWDVARTVLETKLKAYNKKKSKAFSKKHSLTWHYKSDELFLVSLRGGCKAAGWVPEGGFFTKLMVEEDGKTVWYEPTTNNTWLRVEYENFRIGKEISGDQGPVDLKHLLMLAKEMTEESGVKFYVHKNDIEDEHFVTRFEKITYLDGTSYETPPKEECDHSEYECQCHD